LLDSKIDNATEATLFELEYQLAIQYNQANRNKEAFQLLLKILTSDIGFENGEYRRKLYSLLY